MYTRRSHEHIHANILTRTQTHSRSDSLALRLTSVQSLVIRPIVFLCVVYPATIRHAPHAVRGPIGSATEEDTQNCGTHNCIWLGPSPG
eukprot:5731716-Pyramimonas_sp.AAC.1